MTFILVSAEIANWLMTPKGNISCWYVCKTSHKCLIYYLFIDLFMFLGENVLLCRCTCLQKKYYSAFRALYNISHIIGCLQSPGCLCHMLLVNDLPEQGYCTCGGKHSPTEAFIQTHALCENAN